MRKWLQVLLFVLFTSFAIGARLNMMGWFYSIGIASVLILTIAHFYIHFYSMNLLALPSAKHSLQIIASHLLFLNLFLFQQDADDSRTYLVLEYITGMEDTGLESASVPMLIISLVFYIIVSVLMVREAKKYALKAANHLWLMTAIVATLLLPWFFMFLIEARLERKDAQKNEHLGEFNSLERALSNKEEAKVLNLGSQGAKYKSFPEDVLELSQLEELFLPEHSIRSIPNDIGKLKKLRILDLVGNDIDTINPAICDCKELKELRVGGTFIPRLPDCLTKMAQLEYLEVESNSVNSLMDELRKFNSLRSAHFYTRGDTLFDREKWWKISAELGLKQHYER